MSHSDDRASLRQILASTSIVGGATAVTIVVALIRTKVLAVLVGPAGIGLIGVFGSIMATASAIGGMGLAFSGVRQIAAEQSSRTSARRAIWLATWPLAVVSALFLWLFRTDIARFVIGSADYGWAVGLTAIGVALTILAASQAAIVQGYRLLGAFARMRILGALLSVMISIPAVLYLGTAGLVIAAIAVPAGNLLAALPFMPRPKEDEARHQVPLLDHWCQLFATGGVVMVTTTLASLTLVLVRTIIVRQGGLAQAGLYQAAYSISAVNVSLVLAAMAADYFPRLAAVEKDREASNRLINHQLRSIMLMGIPVLVATVALAPWVTQLLYSSAFRPAAGMLMWQVAGELLKFPVWTLGFLLLARQDNSRFFLTESLFVALYVAGSYLLFPLIGLTGVGLAYLGAYCTDAIMLLVLCRVRHGVVLSAANLWFLAASLATLVALAALAQVRPGIASIAGLAAAVLFAAYAVREFGLAGSVWSRLAPRPRAPE